MGVSMSWCRDKVLHKSMKGESELREEESVGQWILGKLRSPAKIMGDS